MTLSQLFTNNYEYLNVVAKRITRKRGIEKAPELINETYLNLAEKQTPVPVDNEEFVKFFSKCMKNYFTWPNSSFNKSMKLDVNEGDRKKVYENLYYKNNRYAEVRYQNRSEDNFRGELDTNPKGMDGIVDEDAMNDIEIQVEGTNDFTKELLEISSTLGKTKTLKYIELVEFKRSLPDYESILFELYFEKDMSTRDIAKKYTDESHYINYQTINNMVKEIKTKINNYRWKS